MSESDRDSDKVGPWSSNGDGPVRVLLVEDSADYAELISTALGRAKMGKFEVETAERLDSALLKLEKKKYDVMLLDLSLPDGYGTFTIGCACSLANHLPVIVLTGTENDELAMMAVKAGAQEYLVKEKLDRRSLPATILRCIERHRRATKLGKINANTDPNRNNASDSPLRDRVTGLPNDMVFGDRLGHAIAQATRNPTSIGLLFIGIDGLDSVRALHGCDVQDEVMRASALCLSGIVEKGDTLARVNGDTFAIVLGEIDRAEDVEASAQQVIERLAETRPLEPAGISNQTLSASIGVAIYPKNAENFEDLVLEAKNALNAAVRSGGGQCQFSGELHD